MHLYTFWLTVDLQGFGNMVFGTSCCQAAGDMTRKCISLYVVDYLLANKVGGRETMDGERDNGGRLLCVL